MGKKFTFSLEKLLSYKDQLLEHEITVLTELNAHLNRLREELEALYANRKKQTDAMLLKFSQGTTAFEIQRHKHFIEVIDAQIEEKKLSIEKQQKLVAKQMEVVREAKMEVSTIEKLKEKKLEEYNYKENKAQELFIEEFVNNQKSGVQTA